MKQKSNLRSLPKPVVSPPAGPSAHGSLAIQLGYNAATSQVLMKFDHDLCEAIFSAEQAHALGAALIQHAEAARGTKAS